MKLLLLSNMYPSKEKSFAGVFVKNQYEALKTLLPKQDSIAILYMKRSYTGQLGSVVKYLKVFFKFIPHLFKTYDVVHLHYFYPLIYLAVLYKKIHPNTKLVVTYHGSDLTKKITPKNKAHLSNLAKVVDYHIPVGKSLALILKEKLGVTADDILPVGVNDKVFYFEPSNKIYDFIYVGSLVHRKGVDILINAIKDLPLDLKFCIVGQGELVEDVKSLAKSHDNVTFFQGLTQSELQKLISKSKFSVLPTRNEGFPTSTIESMYCGVPIIVSDIPQTLEQVNDSINGFVTPCGDIKALRDKLVEVSKINDTDYSHMVENCLESFKSISLTEVCKRLITIYKGLILK